MASQQPPPSRPWLRLATMIRPATPPPPPSNQGPSPPRPALIRPAFTVAAPPPPPPPQPSPTPPPPQQPNPTPASPSPSPSPSRSPSPSPPPPIVPATNMVEPQPLLAPSRKSPPTTPPRPSAPPASIPPTLTAAMSRISVTRAATPPSSSPKILKPLEPTPPPLRASPPTPPESPPSRSPPTKSNLTPSPPFSPARSSLITPSSPTQRIPPTVTPLSPLKLPSVVNQKPYDDGPQVYKQKTVDVHETKEKLKNSATGFNGRHTAHNFTRKHETDHKKHWDSEDGGKNIITIAGENKGAIMKITPFSHKQHDHGNNIHVNRLKPTTSNINGDTDSEAKNKDQTSNSLLKTALLNSNVQGVNNSILCNCSINYHDPGIHLTLSTKSDRDFGIHYSKDQKKG
ncbi:hypothetical protein R6Q59_032347 [Mikania micrantha]|uniref:Uncharacterized protein n=1 Tax=Mikania micrantha TaxID=192012 RepID=A0A5N6NS56_9ASTR|nr:hypothetical protein E3N88_17016 [Mikania micrantha]